MPFETFDIGNVLGTVDAIKTARLRDEMAAEDRQFRQQEMDFRQQEMDMRRREFGMREQAFGNALADQSALRGARAEAFGGDFTQLQALDPQEAIAIQSYFSGLSEERRARELEEAQQEIEEMGRVAAWVQTQDDPAAAWSQVYANLDPEEREGLPEQYSPEFVSFTLAKMMSVDQLLEQLSQKRSKETFESALGGDLIGSESGGDFMAQNDAMGAGGQKGHFGRGQFGIARLADAKAAGIIPASVSPEVFMRNPDMQARVEQWHRDDILAAAESSGVTSLIGQTVNGMPVTEQSIINVAHLGGKQGMVDYFTSGGEYDPADANGTHLSDYHRMGAEEAGAAPQPDAGPQIDPAVGRLMAAAGDPSLDEQQRDILLKAAEMLQPPEPPNPPSSVAEYQFAVQQAQEQGLPPLPPYSQWLLETKRAGATQVNVGAQQERAAQQQAQAASIVLEDIRRVKGLDESAYLPTTGALGWLLSNVPGTAAADTSKLLDGIQANIGFDKLMAMKQASPTGGALGSVTEREMSLLQATLGSLEQSQSHDQFLYNLDRLAQVYETAMANIAAAAAQDGVDPSQFGLPAPQAGAPAPPAPPAPSASGAVEAAPGIPQSAMDAGIDPNLWQFMTPEEQALWN